MCPFGWGQRGHQQICLGVAESMCFQGHGIYFHADVNVYKRVRNRMCRPDAYMCVIKTQQLELLLLRTQANGGFFPGRALYHQHHIELETHGDTKLRLNFSLFSYDLNSLPTTHLNGPRLPLPSWERHQRVPRGPPAPACFPSPFHLKPLSLHTPHSL